MYKKQYIISQYKNIYIKNIRDIKIFLNHFMFVYSSLKDENLYLLDIISISMIETFENDLYEYIINNKELFCSYTGTDNDGIIYIYNNNKINFNQKLQKMEHWSIDDYKNFTNSFSMFI